MRRRQGGDAEQPDRGPGPRGAPVAHEVAAPAAERRREHDERERERERLVGELGAPVEELRVEREVHGREGADSGRARDQLEDREEAELEDAARVDGLGWFGIFFFIALPLARSALGAVAIFTFLQSWNLYLEPIVYLSSPAMFTLPQALTQFTDAYGGALWNVQLAAASMTALPVLVVFIVAQKQFVEGLAQTGLKG